jgi:hypothetical protein
MSPPPFLARLPVMVLLTRRAGMQGPQAHARERYRTLVQTALAGVQPNAGTTAVVLRDLLRRGNAHGAVDVFAAGCALGALQDATCDDLLQAALTALARPELPQPQLAEVAPAPTSQLTAAPATVVVIAAAPDAHVPDMGEGWLPAGLLAEPAGASEVATRASGARGCGHSPAPIRFGSVGTGPLFGTTEEGGMQPASCEPPAPGESPDGLPH